MKYPKTEEIERRQVDRLTAFSDGVFAIAITLLVLNLDVGNVTDDALGERLRELDPNLLAYFIGFAVIGMFWYGHHQVFASLERSSPALVGVNLVLLSLIGLMPFTTSLIGEHGDVAAATALYALNVGLASLVDSILDQVASRRHLGPPMSPFDRRRLTIDGIMRTSIFLGSIPLAFASTEAAQLSWLLLLAAPRLSARLARRAEEPGRP